MTESAALFSFEGKYNESWEARYQKNNVLFRQNKILFPTNFSQYVWQRPFVQFGYVSSRLVGNLIIFHVVFQATATKVYQFSVGQFM